MECDAILRPAGTSSYGGWTSLQWELKYEGAEPFLLTHAVKNDDALFLADPERGDHALVAVLLWAMNKGFNLVIEGKLSPMLLDGLETLQEIWHRWRPERYKIISIQAKEESAPECLREEGGKAIVAFSGGVDAAFTFFRHFKKMAGRKNRFLSATLLVQGMDIPIDRDDYYVLAERRARSILANTNIPLMSFRTNSRLLGQDWEDSYGLQLSSCFLALQKRFSYALKGSGEPYNGLVLPWGSTPMTDVLCSTEALIFEHDGAAFDRTEKVEWLSENTSICDYLRVCWAGPNLGENCGECEKCIRTMLNFWATKQKIPKAFPVGLTAEKIKSVKPKNDIQLGEIQTLYRHACFHHDESSEIMKAIRFITKRYYTEKNPKDNKKKWIRQLPWPIQKQIYKILK